MRWVCMCSRPRLMQSSHGLSPRCLSSCSNFWAWVTTIASLLRATPTLLHHWPSFCVVPSLNLILAMLRILGLSYWSLRLAVHLFCTFLTLTYNCGCCLMRQMLLAVLSLNKNTSLAGALSSILANVCLVLSPTMAQLNVGCWVLCWLLNAGALIRLGNILNSTLTTNLWCMYSHNPSCHVAMCIG